MFWLDFLNQVSYHFFFTTIINGFGFSNVYNFILGKSNKESMIIKNSKLYKIKMKSKIVTIFLVAMMSASFLAAQSSQETTTTVQETEQGGSVLDALSPDALRGLQEKEKKTKVDRVTVKELYGDIDFISVRSFDFGYVFDYGFKNYDPNSTRFEKNLQVSKVEGYNFGVVWEFPILRKTLGGSSPMIKASAGKKIISFQSDSTGDASTSTNSETTFVDALDKSEVYTVAIGGGYCFNIGFNCAYAMYDNYLTGQMSVQESDGSIATVPTQLTGFTLGLSSIFEVTLGIEVGFALEYSMLTHKTPVTDSQQFNTVALVISLGLNSHSRFLDMGEIEAR